MLDQDVALALAEITSSASLQSYLRTTPLKSSPLGSLSDSARKRFVESITFNEKGITGFNYADLQAELTPSQTYKVLSLFGAQHTTSMIPTGRIASPLDATIMESSGPSCPSQPCDYEDYECSDPHTCVTALTSICMRNC